MITEPDDCLLFQGWGCSQWEDVGHLAKFIYRKEVFTTEGRDIGVTDVYSSTVLIRQSTLFWYKIIFVYVTFHNLKCTIFVLFWVLKNLFLPFSSQPHYLFYILPSHRDREWGYPNIQFETYISEYEILRKINWIGKQLLASNIVLSQVNLHWILLNLSKSSLILS